MSINTKSCRARTPQETPSTTPCKKDIILRSLLSPLATNTGVIPASSSSSEVSSRVEALVLVLLCPASEAGVFPLALRLTRFLLDLLPSPPSPPSAPAPPHPPEAYSARGTRTSLGSCLFGQTSGGSWGVMGWRYYSGYTSPAIENVER